MNLRQLEILRGVVRTGSTVGAANILNMSQPAVSNAIKSAELSLGFRLFDRVNKRLIPTHEALMLLDQAEPMFLVRDLVEQTAQQLRDGRKGRVNVVATAELSDSLLPQSITAFLKDRPKVSITLETLRLDNVVEYVESGIADIGFAMEPHPRPTLDYVPLASLDIVCLCPADSPLCERPYLTPADLRDVPLINASTRSRLYNMVTEAFRDCSVPYSPIINVRFMNLAALFVQEGLGVAILDALTASSKRFHGVRSVPFRPQIRVNLNAIIAVDRPMQRLTRNLIHHAQEELRQLLPSR